MVDFKQFCCGEAQVFRGSHQPQEFLSKQKSSLTSKVLLDAFCVFFVFKLLKRKTTN